MLEIDLIVRNSK